MNWLRRLLIGRYGLDQFSVGLLIFSFSISLIQGFVHAGFFRSLFFLVSFAGLAFCYFRIFSKNIEKRRQENEWFLLWWRPASQWLWGRKAAFEELQSYKHFKCPQCGQKIRIPRGKGHIAVTCPACHTGFIKKT